MDYGFDRAECEYLTPPDNFNPFIADDLESAQDELSTANSYIEFLEAQIKEYKESLSTNSVTDELLELKDTLIDMQEQEIKQYRERLQYWQNSYFELNKQYLSLLKRLK